MKNIYVLLIGIIIIPISGIIMAGKIESDNKYLNTKKQPENVSKAAISTVAVFKIEDHFSDEDTRLVFNTCKSLDMTDKQSLYVLAQIMIEHGGRIENKKETLGENREYAPYYGRGYIQITGVGNYKFFGQEFQSDILNNPDIVLNDKSLSARIACSGIKHGSFAPKAGKLNSYNLDDNNDIKRGRAIVNGDGNYKRGSKYISNLLLEYYQSLRQKTGI